MLKVLLSGKRSWTGKLLRDAYTSSQIRPPSQLLISPVKITANVIARDCMHERALLHRCMYHDQISKMHFGWPHADNYGVGKLVTALTSFSNNFVNISCHTKTGGYAKPIWRLLILTVSEFAFSCRRGPGTLRRVPTHRRRRDQVGKDCDRQMQFNGFARAWARRHCTVPCRPQGAGHRLAPMLLGQERQPTEGKWSLPEKREGSLDPE